MVTKSNSRKDSDIWKYLLKKVNYHELIFGFQIPQFDWHSSRKKIFATWTNSNSSNLVFSTFPFTKICNIKCWLKVNFELFLNNNNNNREHPLSKLKTNSHRNSLPNHFFWIDIPFYNVLIIRTSIEIFINVVLGNCINSLWMSTTLWWKN